MNLTDAQAPSPPSGAPREQTPIFQAIAYGIQAPNPHNTPAWRFELVSDTEALLYIDERRLLPATDPPARQIHIGAGCCIETLAVGMSESGYEIDVEYLPRGAHGLEEVGRKPVARVALRPSASGRREDLADVIGQRQTNRTPYTGPLLSDEEAQEIRGQVSSDERRGADPQPAGGNAASARHLLRGDGDRGEDAPPLGGDEGLVSV